MKTPHKHAALIHAWADGAEIESKHFPYDPWHATTSPAWFLSSEYRIKPEKKPDIVTTRFVSATITRDFTISYFDNLRLTFDGETGVLKSAEVIV